MREADVEREEFEVDLELLVMYPIYTKTLGLSGDVSKTRRLELSVGYHTRSTTFARSPSHLSTITSHLKHHFEASQSKFRCSNLVI